MQVTEGQGWRLVVDPHRQPFSVLLGGSLWSVELTGAEALALADAVAVLLEQHRRIADQLMADEDLELDLERGNLWVGLTVHQSRWSLRFVLESPAGLRSVEAGWDEAASPALALALEALPQRLFAQLGVVTDPAGDGM